MACSCGRDQPGAGHSGSTTGYEAVHTMASWIHGLSHSLIVSIITKTIHNPIEVRAGRQRSPVICGAAGLRVKAVCRPLGVRRRKALAAPVRRVGEVGVHVRAYGLSRSG